MTCAWGMNCLKHDDSSSAWPSFRAMNTRPRSRLREPAGPALRRPRCGLAMRRGPWFVGGQVACDSEVEPTASRRGSEGWCCFIQFRLPHAGPNGGMPLLFRAFSCGVRRPAQSRHACPKHHWPGAGAKHLPSGKGGSQIRNTKKRNAMTTNPLSSNQSRNPALLPAFAVKLTALGDEQMKADEHHASAEISDGLCQAVLETLGRGSSTGGADAIGTGMPNPERGC